VLNVEAFEWRRVEGAPGRPWTVRYDLCVLGHDRDAGTLDLVIRFDDQGGGCQPHRHVSATSVLVLSGEHHVDEVQPDGTILQKIRPTGTYHLSVGDALAHTERGGPQGAVVFFSHHSDDGRLYEMLDEQGDVELTVTVESLAASWDAMRSLA
jgi:hypothetical protein